MGLDSRICSFQIQPFSNLPGTSNSPHLGRTLSTKVALGRGRPWGKHYRKREQGSHPGKMKGKRRVFWGNFERNECKKSGCFPLVSSSLKSCKANDASEWQPPNFLNIKPWRCRLPFLFRAAPWSLRTPPNFLCYIYLQDDSAPKKFLWVGS